MLQQKKLRSSIRGTHASEKVIIIWFHLHLGRFCGVNVSLCKFFDPQVGSNKANICHFTCAKAVHIVVMQSLTVPAVLWAIRRFADG